MGEVNEKVFCAKVILGLTVGSEVTDSNELNWEAF